MDGGEPSKAEARHGPTQTRGGGRWLRVRVTDLKTGKTKVNVNVPIGLVEIATRLGARFGKMPGLEEVDDNEIVSAIKSGVEGKIVDVEDEQDLQKVEVFVD